MVLHANRDVCQRERAARIVKKWAKEIAAAELKSAPGGTGWRYEHFKLWNTGLDSSLAFILEALEHQHVPGEVRMLQAMVRLLGFLKPDRRRRCSTSTAGWQTGRCGSGCVARRAIRLGDRQWHKPLARRIVSGA